MSAQRLSPLDASFLAVETPDSPMHVGWVATFEGPSPGFDELFAHIAERLEAAPRYRQKLAEVPFGVHDQVWVDDASFDASEHLLHAEGDDLDELVDGILSSPLPRDRPLWQIWITDELPGGRLALIGKMHHCMVDGTAIAELGKALFDASPEAADLRSHGDEWTPAPTPSARSRFTRAIVDRTGDGLSLVLEPLRLAGSPGRLPALASAAARTLTQTVLPPAPSSFLNRAGGAERHHVRVTRTLDEVRSIRRRYGVTPNDVVLAACAGALRRFAERRGERPRPLKIMVPADVRSSDDAAGSGNRISFLFIELPCDEPDPVARLRAVGAATDRRRRDDTAEHLDSAFRTLTLTPRPVQRVLAHAFAHPRLFNVTISSVPGPAMPRYLRGCKLREVHSAVPLAGRHALSVGVVMVAGRVCFGLCADAATLPDADELAGDLDASFEELLAAGA